MKLKVVGTVRLSADSFRIARIFRRLMDQYRERSIQSLNLCRPMTVKRFQLPKQRR
ncbi:hypothetical protein [Paenibacillus sp. NPDC057967]|uniref:hypothetical protein n=1 Tax=Paenibacillus sp. NPDC057967 TaxID=3346293 RepID=UPI0036DB3B28